MIHCIKTFIPFSLCIFLCQINGLWAQKFDPEVIASAGSSLEIGMYNYSWTVGEVAIVSLEGENLNLLQGFHQPMYFLDVHTISGPNNWEVKVYPNPVNNGLRIEIPETEPECTMRLFDLSGKQLISMGMIYSSFEWNTSGIEPGAYLMEIRQSTTGKMKVIRVLKM